MCSAVRSGLRRRLAQSGTLLADERVMNRQSDQLLMKKLSLVLLAALSITGAGCGSEEPQVDNADAMGAAADAMTDAKALPFSDGSGVVTDAFESFCIATFTEDVVVTDGGREHFIVREAEQYVLRRYDTSSGMLRAELLHFLPGGAFEFETETDINSPVFTSNCEPSISSTASLAMLLEDFTIYETSALEAPLCSLNATAIVGAYGCDDGQCFVSLVNFSELCNDATTGYIPPAQAIQSPYGLPVLVMPVEVVLSPVLD